MKIESYLKRELKLIAKIIKVAVKLPAYIITLYLLPIVITSATIKKTLKEILNKKGVSNPNHKHQIIKNIKGRQEHLRYE